MTKRRNLLVRQRLCNEAIRPARIHAHQPVGGLHQLKGGRIFALGIIRSGVIGNATGLCTPSHRASVRAMHGNGVSTLGFYVRQKALVTSQQDALL